MCGWTKLSGQNVVMRVLLINSSAYSCIPQLLDLGPAVAISNFEKRPSNFANVLNLIGTTQILASFGPSNPMYVKWSEMIKQEYK